MKIEIRVIAPSQSWQKRREAAYKRARQRIEAKGFKVTFGENVMKKHRFNTASVADRIVDLHAAYQDKNVAAIWCLDGGWSANELLPYIDWALVKANPKPLVGYSDITVLLNAAYTKTRQVGLLAPNFATLGSTTLFEDAQMSLIEALSKKLKWITPSKEWSNGDDVPRRARRWFILSEGEAQGTAIGGNLGSFYLLQGTPFQPKFNKDTILLLEDDDEAGAFGAREFDRRFESILQLQGAREAIKGVLIGRFQPASKVSRADIADIVRRKLKQSVPVIADVNFGHTMPQATFPIGGIIKISALQKRAQIELVEY